MNRAELNIKFVINESATASADQMRKWKELYNRLMKREKRAGESARETVKDAGKRIYKTCGFISRWLNLRPKHRANSQIQKCEYFYASVVPLLTRRCIDASGIPNNATDVTAIERNRLSAKWSTRTGRRSSVGYKYQ
jgi:hypothetical protein